MATKSRNVRIAADAERQVLRLNFSGSVTVADFQGTGERAEAIIASMKPGFTVFTDLTGLEGMDLECVPELTRWMDRFVAAGAGRVVRIIPDPDKDIGFNLLSLTHYRGHIPTVTFETCAEAEQALKGPH